MKVHIDLLITTSDKEKMKNNKENKNISLSEQINNVFNYFNNISVEDFANIMVSQHSTLSNIKTTTLTVNKKHLIDNDYFIEINQSLKTKIPKLDYKRMVLLMINFYLNKR
jgi:hypothetical protein